MIIRTHSDGVNAVRLLISELGGMSLKYTVGKFRALDSDRVITVGEPGVGDTINNIGGLFFGIEVKVSDTDELSKEQESFRDALIASGGRWVLADFRHGRDGLKAVREAIMESFNQTARIIRSAAAGFSIDIPPGVAMEIAKELHP